MWENIKEVLVSENFLQTVVGVGALIVILAVLAKRGLLSFKGKGLRVGNVDNTETERNIIRSQILYVKSAISDFYDEIPNFDGRNEWKLRFICEKIVSIFMDIICLNHISRERIYTEMKQASVWAVIVSNTESDVITSDEFKEIVYSKTTEILDKLISIREYYNTEENRCVV